MSSLIATYRQEDQPPKLRRYRQAAQASGDDDLIAFVAGLEEVFDAGVRYTDRYNDKELRGLRPAEVVQAVGGDAFSFTFVEANTVYTLTFDVRGDVSELRKALDSSIARDLRASMTAIERIRQNAADDQLSQSPAPTVPRPVDTVGRTRILEPCAVLSREVFEQVTGLRDNQAVERVSVPLIPAGTAIEPEQGDYNSCRRHHQRDLGSLSTDLDVSLTHWGSPERARKQLERGGYLDGRVVETDADLTLFSEDGPFEGIVLHTVLVGPYWMDVDFSTLTAPGAFQNGVSGYASDVDYVRAINALTESLKRNLARAERTDGK